MTLERLKSLSDDTLISLADELEVDWSDDDGRDVLIGLLLDAYRDLRTEREAINNNPVNVQEKKYDIQEELVQASGYGEGIADMPLRYNESRITLLLRDPAWAYCYWDINDEHLAELASEQNQAVTGLVLHVIEVACCSKHQDTIIDSFEVPVAIDDTNWYINLPNRDTFYRVRLMLQLEETEVMVAESNAIQVPLGVLASKGDESPGTDALIALSGIENLGVSSFGAGVPHRVRSFSDRSFQE
jgi:hypothetical protein